MSTPRTPSSKDREQSRSHVPASSSSSVGTIVSSGPSSGALPTLASLLTMHASASNPMQAAAEAALIDRNVLDTQNKQLWKLIEKQRLAYNQMLKDLERIRAERDALKAKLASGSNHPDKTVRPSASSSAIHQPSRSSVDEAQRPRNTRHQSEGTDSSISSTKPPPPTPSRSTSNNLVQGPVRGESLPTVTPSAQSSNHTPLSNAETLNGSQKRQNAALNSNPNTKVDFPSSRPFISIPAPAPSQLLSAVSEDSNSRASRESRISLPDEARMYLMNGSPLPSPNPGHPQPAGLSPGHSNTRSPRSSEDPSSSPASLFEISSPASSRPRSALPNTSFAHHSKSASDVREVRLAPQLQASTAYQNLFSQQTDASSTLVDSESEGLDNHDRWDDNRARIKPGERDLTPPRTTAPSQQTRQVTREADVNYDGMQTPGRSKYIQRDDREEEDPNTSMLQSLQPRLRIGTESLEQAKQKLSPFGDPISATTSSPSFRALPLLSTDLPHTTVSVPSSSVRFNDRGKEVLSFLVEINPGKGKERWQVEKLYSDVLGLDQRLRNMVGRSLGKKMGVLPEGKLWRHDAPAKIDQRKAALETYLQGLINLPVKNKDEIIAFFTSDVVRETKKPVMQAGYKEGYLTKRGQKLGGWKTRYFVVHGPVLDYYDNRGGAHLGSINITGAQIGRQTKTDEEENDYRHAFLIMELKRGGSPTRHVLCAESDTERDAWIDVLLKYVRGTFIDDLAPTGSLLEPGVSRASMSSVSSTSLALDNSNMPLPLNRMTRSNEFESHTPGARGSSPVKPEAIYAPQSSSTTITDADIARRLMERSQGPVDSILSSSVPSTSSLDAGQAVLRSSSEQGHYPDPSVTQTRQRSNHVSPEREKQRFRDRKAAIPSLTVSSNTSNTPEAGPPVSEMNLQTPRAKISGPMGGTILPGGYKFGSNSSPAEIALPASTDKRDKAKMRNFWAFGKNNGDKAAIKYTNRDVFGVTIEESLEVASIANLPAVVFRCIQFLEAKNADQEEGIYRLSGSSAVIKGLKDRFNTESDINLLESEEYWDPHAIAGLLKTFLRDLPTSILTRELHLRFLSVIDFVDSQERIQELANLISALPLPNYSLLRALTAHLILIVQNANVNKMTMRNVGIVFSPTLGIPAGVFGLMLGEFNRVFNVDEGEEPWDGAVVGSGEPVPLDDAGLAWRNSRQYTDAAADHLLGIAGRTLSIPESDGETASSEYESEAESVNTVESDEPAFQPLTPKSKATHQVAASRGLNIEIAQSSRGNRHSRILGGIEGLPPSPKPVVSPTRTSHSTVR